MAKKGDSEEQPQDDSETAINKQLPDHACPQKSASIQSSDNSASIKDLLTSCDLCTKELLTQTDFERIENLLNPPDASNNILPPPADSSIKELFSQTGFCNSVQHNVNDSNVRDLMENYANVRELLIRSDSCTRDVLLSPHFLECNLLLQNSGCTNELHTESDTKTKDPLSRVHFDMGIVTPDIKDIITLRDSVIYELLSTENSSVDQSISPNSLSKDDSDIKELLSSGDSYIYETLSPEDSYTYNILSSGDPHLQVRLSPRGFITQGILPPGGSYIQERVLQGDSYSHESLSLRDSNTKEGLSPGDSCIQERLSTGNSYTKEGLSPEDSCTHDKLSLGDSYTLDTLSQDSKNHETLSQVDSYNQETISPANSLINELRTQECSYLNEAFSHIGSYLSELPTPEDPIITELLNPVAVNSFELSTSRNPHIENVGELLYLPQEQLTSFRMKLLRQPALVSMVSECTWNRPRSLSSTLMTPDSVLYPSPIYDTESKLRCHSMESPKLTEDMMLHHHSCLYEMLLVKAGDVELNPGPHDRPADMPGLQDKELLMLSKDIPRSSGIELGIALGFKYEECKNILNEPNSGNPVLDLLCRWKIKQKDDTVCRTILGLKLEEANLGGLKTKLLRGGYLSTSMTTVPSSDPVMDASQSPRDTMTDEQIAQCSNNFKSFYRERMCNIKPDPLDFNSIQEFESIYTNLTLLKKKKGGSTKTPLEYSALFSTENNGVLPKRLLVEGEGGVGKTTFCSKIAWDWANESSQFQDFDWVLVIPLRKIVKGQTIGDIVKNYLSDRNRVTPRQINNYIYSHPEQVLIILDGLDEYDGDFSADGGSDIYRILRLEIFKEGRVLVTTRPWRAQDIKSDKDLSESYAFLAVTGFSADNVSTYINKYFHNDEMAGTELIQFIEDNDVIRDNMAPFPIYVAMLCILWKNSDNERRETIRKLKTFSQFFNQMMIFLKDHYISKVVKKLDQTLLDHEIAIADSCLSQIGLIAFSGLMKRKLIFDKDDFSTCTKAMETCCRIGVLSRDQQNIPRFERSQKAQKSINISVFFPHKLFQEYVSALYLASLYDTDYEAYNSSINAMMDGDIEEFRYLLYFTAAQGNKLGLDIVEKVSTLERYRPRFYGEYDFLVDVTFEAYNKDTAKSVAQETFKDEKTLTIEKDMSAHTVSGYLFIMEQHGIKTLTLYGRSCGPTVSRDLADILSSSGSLSRIEFQFTSLDGDFYRLMKTRGSTTVLKDESNFSVKELHVDHRFIGDLQRFGVTIGDLFPSLQRLAVSTLQTVSPSVIKHLKHPSLEVLSIESDDDHRDLEDDEDYTVPLTGDPATLGQLFSDSFPKLTSLTFEYLVIGIIRCKAILQTLRKHQHIRDISIIHCFTDDELDPLAREIASHSEVEVTLKHDPAQLRFPTDVFYELTSDLIDALCHRTCVRELILENDIICTDSFPDLYGREVDSKIEKLECHLDLRDNQSASRCLGKFISLLPCLTDLMIYPGSFREAFYEEILNRSSSSKIQTLTMSKNPFGYMHVDPSACGMLGRLLCLLPCLTDLTIDARITFHDQFYEEVFAGASSSKIQTLTMITTSRAYKPVDPDPSVCTLLGRFLCLLPCLTDLTIDIDITLHDQFYEELSAGASFSKNPYFRNSKHEVLMQKWSECKHQERLQLHQQQQQQQQDLQLQFILLEQSKIPTLHENSESLEQVTPSLLHHQRSEQPSVQFQNDDQVGVHAEPEHVQPFQGLVQNYPGSSCIPVVRYPLPEAGEYAGNPSLHHVSRGVREPTHLAMGQGLSGLEDQTQNEQTLLVSYSSSDDDEPSTSGWKTTEGRTEPGLIESERAGKRIHSDSDDNDDRDSAADKSKERCHGKRRKKTDREPTSQ